MIPRNFKKLCAAIQSKWTPSDGLVVLLSDKHCTTQYKLCINGRGCASFIPENCILWYDDMMLYNGALADIKLQQELTKRHICKAAFTTSGKMRADMHMAYKCVGCKGKTCKDIKCKCMEME